jgi:GNAT superfamily N-acetyltransferase
MGYATKLYQEAARIAAEKGFALCSDAISSIDPKAMAFWEKQVEKGRAVWEVPGPAEREGFNYDYGRFVIKVPPPASLGAVEDAEAKLKELEAGWKALGVDIDAYISRGDLHLSRIEIEKGQRGQGIGTKAMEDLLHLADAYGLRITLSPSTDFGGTSVERLKRFYRRFGFVSNKGRHKDFTLFDSMYRNPR